MAAEIFKLVGRITYEGQRKVEAGLDRLEKKIHNAERQLDQFGDRAQKVGGKMKEIGEGATKYLSLPLMAVGGVGLKMANDMQVSQGRIQASLGATAEETERLHGIAKNLWKDAYGENVVDTGNAVATVNKNMKDLSDTDLQTVTSQAYVLQDLFQYGINESTRAGKTLMQNFGLEAGLAMDYITVGAQKGGDYSDELLDTINEFSPQFAEAGLKADDMFNLLLQGAEQGAWNIDKVADAVKEWRIEGEKNGERIASGYETIGMNADVMAEKIAAGGETGRQAFMATITALANMDDKVKRNQAGAEIFGTQWEDVGGRIMTSLDPTKDMLGEVEGATKKAGDALYDNLGTKAQSALRSFMDNLYPLAEALLEMVTPAIEKLGQKAEQLGNWFGSLSDENRKWLVILSLAAAAIGPLTVVLGIMISTIGTIATAIAGVGLAMSAWIVGIGLLVGAVILAYNKFAWFRDGVNAVFAFIWSYVQPILTQLVAFFQQKVQQILAFWNENGAMIQAAFQRVFNFILTIIKGVLIVLMPIIQGFISGIKSIISGGLNIIMGLVKAFSALLTGNWKALWEGIKQFLGGAIQLIWGLINVGFLGRIFGVIRTFATKAFSLFKKWGGNLVGFIKGFAGRMRGRFTSMMDSIALKIMYGVDKVKGFFSGMVSAVKTKIGSMVSNVKSRFTTIKNAIMDPIRAARKFVGEQIEKIKGFFSGLKLKLPKIKLPHFSLNGSFSLKPPRVPSLSVDWYAKGAVFGGPSVIGVGEEPGVSEAVIPLKDSVLANIGKGIAQASGGGAAGEAMGQGAQTLVANIYLGSKLLGQIVQELAPQFDKELGKRTNRAEYQQGG